MADTAYQTWLSSLQPGTTTLPFGNYAAASNAFQNKEAISPFLANLPNYTANVFQRGQVTNQMLKGQVPDDVLAQLSQSGAERGIATGSSGSPNANSAWLRALGLTSIDLQEKGSDMLSKSIADTPTADLTNPVSLYMPQYNAQQELGQTISAQRTQQLQDRNKAASEAWNAGKSGTSYSNWYGMGI